MGETAHQYTSATLEPVAAHQLHGRTLDLSPLSTTSRGEPACRLGHTFPGAFGNSKGDNAYMTISSPGDGCQGRVRSVDLLRVREGNVAEKRSYVER